MLCALIKDKEHHQRADSDTSGSQVPYSARSTLVRQYHCTINYRFDKSTGWKINYRFDKNTEK